jgi:hypothetical protein
MNALSEIKWYVPSFYGDIRLEAKDKMTVLHAEALTPLEADALRRMREAHSESGVLSEAWATVAEFAAAGISGCIGDPYRGANATQILLKAPVLKVERALTKLLKGDRRVVRAVVFKTGPEPEVVAVEEAAKREDKPKAGASVAQPFKGCPIPDFETVNVRATRVLKEFLSPRQLTDFERSQQFIVEGADTGRRYMLTSRNAGASFQRMGRSSVFDLDIRAPLCVHDWAVPPAEELLAMLMCFKLKGGETAMLQLPEMAHV